MADVKRNIQLKDSTGQWDVYPITVANEVKFIHDDNKTVTTVKDEITKIQLHTYHLQGKIESLEEGNIGEIEASRVTYQGEQLDVVLGQCVEAVNDNTSDISQLTNRVKTLETNGAENVSSEIAEIKALNTTQTNQISTLNTKVQTLESKTTALGSTVTGHASSLSSLDKRLDTAETDINNIKITNTSQTNQISTINSDIQNLESKDIHLESRIEAAEADIVTHTKNISSLSTRVTDNEYDITDNTSNINSLKDRVTSIESEISGAKGYTYTSLDARFDSIDNKIKSGQEDHQDLVGRVDTAESNITGLDNRLDTAESNITSLDSRVTKNEGDIDTIETFVNDIKIPEEHSWLFSGKEYIDFRKIAYVEVNGSSIKTNYPYMVVNNHDERITELESTCESLNQSIIQSRYIISISIYSIT